MSQNIKKHFKNQWFITAFLPKILHPFPLKQLKYWGAFYLKDVTKTTSGRNNAHLRVKTQFSNAP